MDQIPIDGHGSAILGCVDDGIPYDALSVQRTLLDLGVQKTNAAGDPEVTDRARRDLEFRAVYPGYGQIDERLCTGLGIDVDKLLIPVIIIKSRAVQLQTTLEEAGLGSDFVIGDRFRFGGRQFFGQEICLRVEGAAAISAAIGCVEQRIRGGLVVETNFWREIVRGETPIRASVKIGGAARNQIRDQNTIRSVLLAHETAQRGYIMRESKATSKGQLIGDLIAIVRVKSDARLVLMKPVAEIASGERSHVGHIASQ